MESFIQALGEVVETVEVGQGSHVASLRRSQAHNEVKKVDEEMAEQQKRDRGWQIDGESERQGVQEAKKRTKDSVR